MWFRVKINDSGAIRACDLVEASSCDGDQIRYIEAASKALACDYAKRWWKANRKRIVAAEQAKEEIRVQRRLEREKQSDKIDAYRKQREKEQRKLRGSGEPLDLHTLISAQRAYVQNPRGFSKWLEDRIEAERRVQNMPIRPLT